MHVSVADPAIFVLGPHDRFAGVVLDRMPHEVTSSRVRSRAHPSAHAYAYTQGFVARCGHSHSGH